VDRLFFSFSYERVRQRQQVNLNSSYLGDSQSGSVNRHNNSRDCFRCSSSELLRSFRHASFHRALRCLPRRTNTMGVLNQLQTVAIRTIPVARRLSRLTTRRSPNLIATCKHDSRFWKHNLYSARQVFTLNDTQSLIQCLVDEFRLGFNRLSSATVPNAQLKSSRFRYKNGITVDRLPQDQRKPEVFENFGGSIYPTRRVGGHDFSDWRLVDLSAWKTLVIQTWRWSIASFYNNKLSQGTGAIQFSQVFGAFIDGNANSFQRHARKPISSIHGRRFGFLRPG
jgi:hypothetical protein